MAALLPPRALVWPPVSCDLRGFRTQRPAPGRSGSGGSPSTSIQRRHCQGPPSRGDPTGWRVVLGVPLIAAAPARALGTQQTPGHPSDGCSQAGGRHAAQRQVLAEDTEAWMVLRLIARCTRGVSPPQRIHSVPRPSPGRDVGTYLCMLLSVCYVYLSHTLRSGLSRPRCAPFK